jgi:acetyl-CoA acyltransferase
MNDAVIVDVVRTASGKGKPGGAFSQTHPTDLLGAVLRALLERNGLESTQIDDVLVGCVSQVGEQSGNVARNALLAAGFDERVPGVSIDRQCGSSQQAAHFAAQGVIAGAYDIAIAAGVEVMSRVPLGSSAGGASPLGAGIEARYPKGLVNQGISAELIAAKWDFNRAGLDEFSAESHRRAAAAAASGAFERELLPVTLADGRVVDADETIRADTTTSALAQLKPAFYTEEMALRFPQIDWEITAGNSSPLTDAASGALIMSESMAQKLGLTPRARFHSFAVVGDDPLFMLTGPIPATHKILERSGLAFGDLDVYEVNEAFASVVLAWEKELHPDMARVNVNGGAIALGHPLGCSGSKLMATLVNELERSGGRYGLQTMCEGGGMANATIIERM